MFDIVAFFNAFGDQDPQADVAPAAGTFDIFDILGYFTLFGAGCP